MEESIMKKIYLLTFAALLAFGCNKIETPETADDGAMRFNVEYPATKATETSFEAGDRIGVYITAYDGNTPLPLQLGGNYKNNNPVTFDGTSWTADPVIYWGEGKYDVYAYYPFMNPQSVDELQFSVALDQRTAETADALSAYEASDFLYAVKRGVTSADGEVRLPFKHKMSKLTVNITKGEDFEGDIPEDMTVYIHNTVTDCLIDLSTGDIVKDPYASAQTVTARKIDAGTHTAIIVPQMLVNKKPLVEIIFRNVSYMVESKFNFKSGMHHVLNITLNNNPDKVNIEIGGEIENWN
ncbi:MAG: fimbrillin family protein [Bacteroidales bacterium]|nr:fimbrillin family protein [Bacteroidales bacterium]